MSKRDHQNKVQLSGILPFTFCSAQWGFTTAYNGPYSATLKSYCYGAQKSAKITMMSLKFLFEPLLHPFSTGNPVIRGNQGALIQTETKMFIVRLGIENRVYMVKCCL